MSPKRKCHSREGRITGKSQVETEDASDIAQKEEEVVVEILRRLLVTRVPVKNLQKESQRIPTSRSNIRQSSRNHLIIRSAGESSRIRQESIKNLLGTPNAPDREEWK